MVVAAPVGVWAQPPSEGLADLAEEVRHSVVNLFTTQIVKMGRQPGMGEEGPLRDFFGDEFFERFFGGSPQRERRANALGSGFVISSDGLILTNHHVVARAEEIKVRMENDKEYDAKLVGSDPKTDLALIQISPDKDFPSPARIGNSDAIRVGAGVMAVGNPFGLGLTVTSGILSAKGRIIGAGPYDDFLQTDAAINPGNSGGPLFNMQGEVIGINTAIVAQGQGIGFAIPINLAVELLPQLKTGRVVRGWLGVMIQDLTRPLAESLGIKNEEGVLVSDLAEDGPAAKAGMQRGDVIVQVDGEQVKEASVLSRKIAATKPDTNIRVTVIRNGKRERISVTLGTLPDTPQEREEKTETPKPSEKWGLSVQNLTPELAQRMGFAPNEKGAVVVDVDPTSPAGQNGLQRGDLIKEVNRKPVENVEDFTKEIGKNDKDSLLLLVRRGEGTIYIVLQK
ncbi:MAG: peptidase [Desulfatitalea sp. BRH_c12]|nr:MAG: peptidase [Desulfatitalea sp. BRH_c12]